MRWRVRTCHPRSDRISLVVRGLKAKSVKGLSSRFARGVILFCGTTLHDHRAGTVVISP